MYMTRELGAELNQVLLNYKGACSSLVPNPQCSYTTMFVGPIGETLIEVKAPKATKSYKMRLGPEGLGE